MAIFGLESVSCTSSRNASTLDNLVPTETKGQVRAEGTLLSAGQYQSLTYQLNACKAVSITLDMQVGLPASTVAVTVLWNGLEVVRGKTIGSNDPATKTWMVGAHLTKNGLNEIRIVVDRVDVSGANASKAKGAMPAGLLLKTVRIGNFEIQQQRQSNWCWIATALSVGYYRNRSSDLGTQCLMYDKIYKNKNGTDTVYRNSCGIRDGEAEGKYNNTGWPASPLAVLKMLGEEIATPWGGMTQDSNPAANWASLWDKVKAETEANRPVICIIAWAKGGGSHAVVLAHVAESGSDKWVIIDDPLKAERRVLSYANLQSSYHVSGDQWTHAIFCK
ncbi:MAG: papain-like cysteine protease family protein [Bacteroidia bacterium]